MVCLVPHRSTNPPASPKPYFNGIRDPEVRLLQQSHNVLKQDGFGKVVPSRVRGSSIHASGCMHSHRHCMGRLTAIAMTFFLT